jgi:hypothetical protein
MRRWLRLWWRARLRDYFAAVALQGLIPTYCQGQPEAHAKWLSKVAYGFADAMLEERRK